MSLFLVYSIVDGSIDGTGQDRITRLKSEYDNYMEFLMVASQQMAGDDSVIVLMVLVIVRSKSVEVLNLLPQWERTCSHHIRGSSGPVSA